MKQLLRASGIEDFLAVSKAQEVPEGAISGYDLVILHVSNEGDGHSRPLRLFIGGYYGDTEVCKKWKVDSQHKYYRYYQIGQNHQGRFVSLISGGTKESIEELLKGCQLEIDDKVHLQGAIDTTYKELLQTKIVPYLKEKVEALEAGLALRLREYALEILTKCRTPEGFDEAEETFKQLQELCSGQSNGDKVAKVYENEFWTLRQKFSEPEQTDIFSPEYQEALTHLKNALFDALKEVTSHKKSPPESEKILRGFKHDCANLFGAVLAQLSSLKQSTVENQQEEIALLTQLVRQNWKSEKGNLIAHKQEEFTAVCKRLNQLGFNVEAECAEEVESVHAAFDAIRRDTAHFHLDTDELQLTPSDLEQIAAHTEEMFQALNTILTGLAQMVSKLPAAERV